MPFKVLPRSIFGRDWWDIWDYPSSILDQCFAVHLSENDLLARVQQRNGISYRPRTQANIVTSGKSEVTNNEKQFQVALSVKQFKPEELEVKVEGDYIVIHGKHEEKSDGHGLVSREFTRRYMLPKSCEVDAILSLMSLEGMLTITAPKKVIEELPTREREIIIEIDQTKENDK